MLYLEEEESEMNFAVDMSTNKENLPVSERLTSPLEYICVSADCPEIIRFKNTPIHLLSEKMGTEEAVAALDQYCK